MFVGEARRERSPKSGQHEASFHCGWLGCHLWGALEQLLHLRGGSCQWWEGAAGNRSSYCPSPHGHLSLRQPESGVSGGVCGSGTHRGDKGGALRESVQGVREGLSEKAWNTHMNTVQGGRNLGTAFQPEGTASARDI